MSIRFHGNQGKLSRITHIDPILLNFATCDGTIVINLHAKNEGNLPHGFRDRPIATERQPDSDWGSGGIGEFVTSLMTSSCARVTSSRARRHATSYYGPLGRARSTEYAKFRIFQIGPLLAEIQPFLWNHVFMKKSILLLTRQIFLTLWSDSLKGPNLKDYNKMGVNSYIYRYYSKMGFRIKEGAPRSRP